MPSDAALSARTSPTPTRFTRRGSRRRLAGAAVLVLGLGAGGRAQAAAPTPTMPIADGQLVSIEVRGEQVKAYTIRPMRSGVYPGVVVIHEWWGLNDQIKGVADRFAEAGYVAIAPDLYRGKIGTDAGLAHDLMRGLNENYAVEVVGKSIAWLRQYDATATRRAQGRRMPIATVGFCMGGRISLASALQGSDLQAVVMFYGSVETDRKALAPLKVPLLGIFGNEDRGIPLDQIQAFKTALVDSGKDGTIIVYPGVGHAFFNEERPGYDREAADDAWQRTQMFLQDRLKEPTTPPVPKKQAPGKDLQE
jgi:carboxymethylenebutenolidase